MSAPRAERSAWLRVLVIVVALVLLAPLLTMVIMMPMMGMMGWWFGGTPGSGAGTSPMWGLGMMLLFLSVLLGTGYFISRAFTRESFSVDDPALEELRLAYARGELSREEFEQRREDLQRPK